MADSERIYSKIQPEPNSGCWLWLGAADRKGYGFTRYPIDGTNRVKNVHRVVYEMERGPIPEGLSIDHICRNPSCVNPDHLEAVPQSENVRRGNSPELSRARMAGNQHYKNRNAQKRLPYWLRD